MRALLLVAALALGRASEAHPRVILVSFDGAGFATTSRLLSEGALPNLSRLVAEGAWSDGMVSSFPTKTAAAHAMLFTGRYGHASGITGNWLLKVPPETGSRLETVSGFFAPALRVDPLWIRAARAGVESYVLHATQTYPFDVSLASLDAEAKRRVYILHGYTDVQLRGEALPPGRVLSALSPGWWAPEAHGTEAREIRFEVGDESFHGILFDDPFDPASGCDTLGVVRKPSDTAFLARVKGGEGAPFSPPIRTEASGRELWFSLRLFELDPGCGRFVLYRSGAVEVARSNDDFPGVGTAAAEVYDGNGGGGVYARGGFGPALGHGGSGEAERRFLETEAHLERQIEAELAEVFSRDYGLVVVYSPVTDDVAHELYGYLSPELDGYDPALAERLWPFLREGFELQDRLLGRVMEAAERDGAHVVLVSDHGMAGTDKLVQLNVALERAGLLALGPSREIDLSRTRALAPPLSDFSVAVNLVDRPGGTVPLDDRDAVLAEIRSALDKLRDPETGERVVTEIFEPATTGLLQPGGASTGDLFVELAPGYYPSTETARDELVLRVEPSGNHGFLPTRREMLSIFAVWGPRVGAGEGYGKVRAIDVAPTVLDLLGLDVPEALPGRSLVRPRGLLQTHGVRR